MNLKRLMGGRHRVKDSFLNPQAYFVDFVLTEDDVTKLVFGTFAEMRDFNEPEVKELIVKYFESHYKRNPDDIRLEAITFAGKQEGEIDFWYVMGYLKGEQVGESEECDFRVVYEKQSGYYMACFHGIPGENIPKHEPEPEPTMDEVLMEKTENSDGIVWITYDEYNYIKANYESGDDGGDFYPAIVEDKNGRIESKGCYMNPYTKRTRPVINDDIIERVEVLKKGFLTEEENRFIRKNYKKGNDGGKFYNVCLIGNDYKYGQYYINPYSMLWRGTTFDEFYRGGVVD